MIDQATTAILLFSRTASEEAAAKTFMPKIGKAGNKAIAGGLIRQSVVIARKTGLPVFTAYSSDQFGTSFGERLANALESIYEKGYERAIVIGNDCPDLTTGTLLLTHEKLANENLVMGPATDGGVYLIGIHKNAYQRQAFLALPWQQSSLQSGWKHYGTQLAVGIDWLESRRDIDQPVDFQRVLRSIPVSGWLFGYLNSVIASFQPSTVAENFTYLSAVESRQPALRGPPH